jgi:hypothetical protein
MQTVLTDDTSAPVQRVLQGEPEAGPVYLADQAQVIVATAEARVEDGQLHLDQFTPLAEAQRFHVDRVDVIATAQGDRQTVAPLRPEQSRFRALVFDAYGGQCAVTGCAIEALLDAAHLRPWRTHNKACDGVLLRCDLHRLFDAGLLTIGPDYRVRARASGYEDLDGRKIRLPKRRADWPRLPICEDTVSSRATD